MKLFNINYTLVRQVTAATVVPRPHTHITSKCHFEVEVGAVAAAFGWTARPAVAKRPVRYAALTTRSCGGEKSKPDDAADADADLSLTLIALDSHHCQPFGWRPAARGQRLSALECAAAVCQSPNLAAPINMSLSAPRPRPWPDSLADWLTA
ncbi:hypothetical protein ACLKA7_001100 [Drosophila subpalustris]